MYLKNRLLINKHDISVVEGDYTVNIDKSIDQVTTARIAIENDIVGIGNDIVEKYPDEKYNIGVLTSDIIDIEDMISDRDLVNSEKVKLINKNDIFNDFINSVSAIYSLSIALDYYYMLYDCYSHDMTMVELPIYKIDTIELLHESGEANGIFGNSSFYKTSELIIVDSDFAFENEGDRVLSPRFACATENLICVKMDKFKMTHVLLSYNMNKNQKSTYIRIDLK